MKIELKKVKYHEDMTEETPCFSAEIHANGKLIGYAKNSGRGGQTDINCYEDCNRDLHKKAVEYCENLPPYVYPACTYSPALEVKMNLTQMVDNLLDDHVFFADLKPYFNKGIVYGVKHGEVAVYGNKTSVAQLKKTKGGQDLLLHFIKKVKSQLTEGQEIFNTNLKGYL